MPDVTIVIDVENGFCKEGNLASPYCKAAIPRIRRIVDERRRAGDTLIFTADTHDPDDREFEVFPVHCVRGTHEAEVVDELRDLVTASNLVRKRRYSAFFETDLDDRLERLQPQTVRVLGVCTDICVLHTVAGLRNRDYHVEVPEAGVDTFDGPGHPHDATQQFALAHLSAVLGAKVVK